MQFDKDMNSPIAELFLDVRAFIMKTMKKSKLKIIERYTPNITSYYCQEYDTGFCYIKTKGNYVHIGWFQGINLEDKDNLLFGNGKIIKGQKITKLDKSEKNAIASYLEQTQILLIEKIEQKEIKKSLKKF